ncbi:MAG TPA: alpha/beta hydrolase-fold protein [Thermoplasmata archaeon]|nr:alpha/beta hydrolase-fold protein [Thermoplasmata archaeon]
MPSWRVPVELRSDEVYPGPLHGKVEPHQHESRALQGNPWGDPSKRSLPVYVPPSGTTRGRPLLVLLSGYSGCGWTQLEPARFMDETIVARLDRLIRSGRAAEAVMVAPDCITSLGGSQYLNSTATGRYEDYVVEEIVPWVQQNYGTGPTAILGTSSGGYGAVVLALRHPEMFPAIGSNAGDAYFEYCYPTDFPATFRELRKDGGPEAFLRKVFARPIGRFTPQNSAAQAMSILAYASCYSPIESEPGRFELPFDLETGALRDDVWSRWLAWDPVRMLELPRYAEAARRLRYVYVDGGTRDEFGLDVSARILAAAIRKQGAPVEHEEFEGGHFDKGPRYDVMIPRLLKALGFPPGS